MLSAEQTWRNLIPLDYDVKEVFLIRVRTEQRIPMFLTYKKGIKLDGSNPTLLYGYGGFLVNISSTPGFFRASRIAMARTWAAFMGCRPASAAEDSTAKKWWEGGLASSNKQNVFDDFDTEAGQMADSQQIHVRTPRNHEIERRSRTAVCFIGAVLKPEFPGLFGAAIARRSA